MVLGLSWSLLAASGVSGAMILTGIPASGLALFGAIAIAFASTVAVDFFARDISPSHSFRSAFDQYLALNILDNLGWIFFAKLRKDTLKIHLVQQEVLLNFLKANADTDYGKRFGFLEVVSREDFVSRHPLTTYADIEPYISRMMAGETNILSKDQPKIFAVTSGTSGRTSVLPFLRKQQSIFFLRGITIMSHLMMTYFPETKNLRKGIKFFYAPRWRTSAAGIPIGPNSSSPASTKSILHLYTTPKAGFEILSEPEALYVHLLFALNDRNAGLVEANFASLVYFAFVFLEKNWEDLVDDVRSGELKRSLNVPEEVRGNLSVLLRADVTRAKELTLAFEAGFVGIAKRIWPKLSLILCVDSGSFANYATILREKYCQGIPIYSPLYAATEGLIGLNLWPLEKPSRYLLVPRAMFFEFIPLEEMDESQPHTVFMGEAEKDGIYELVLTNASGLCRYRFGDVVRVSGHLNQCPIVEFLFRKGQLLNMRGEKMSERTMYEALEKTVVLSVLDVGLIDYTTCESVLLQNTTAEEAMSSAPWYMIFLELSGAVDAPSSLHLQTELDRHLQEMSYVYKSFRVKDSLLPPKICLLESGSFHAFRQFLLSTTDASSNQVKIPRVLKKREHVRFLLSKEHL